MLNALEKYKDVVGDDGKLVKYTMVTSGRNYETGRLIEIRGPTFTRLMKQFTVEIPDFFKSLRGTDMEYILGLGVPLFADIVGNVRRMRKYKSLRNGINYKTGRRIKIEGPIYTRLMRKYTMEIPKLHKYLIDVERGNI